MVQGNGKQELRCCAINLCRHGRHREPRLGFRTFNNLIWRQELQRSSIPPHQPQRFVQNASKQLFEGRIRPWVVTSQKPTVLGDGYVLTKNSGLMINNPPASGRRSEPFFMAAHATQTLSTMSFDRMDRTWIGRRVTDESTSPAFPSSSAKHVLLHGTSITPYKTFICLRTSKQ